jgi:hypothetical protein
MDFYPNLSSVDLRDEMHGLLFGTPDQPPQGIPVILRLLSDTHCACWDQTSGGSRGHCPYCQGEGYQFTESLQTMKIFYGVAPVYKPGFLASGDYPQMQLGNVDPNRATIYCEYDVFPDWERYTFGNKKAFDKIYELKVNDDGSLISNGAGQPVRVAKWKVLNLTPLRGDHGRVEFFELSCERESIS